MTVYAVLYEYADDPAVAEHRPSHRAFLAALHEEGTLLTSGPFADAGGPGALLLLRGDSEQTVRDLLREDPFQQQGLVESVTVREWAPVFGPWAELG
ncbi:MAG TPA: YciI family protein [Ornithinicoccus sp.]|nr:YciI family protein [Ornithinicoccus sp.]